MRVGRFGCSNKRPAYVGALQSVNGCSGFKDDGIKTLCE